MFIVYYGALKDENFAVALNMLISFLPCELLNIYVPSLNKC